MKELKILAVVVALTLVTYWGVEPLAHSIMHPHVADADYNFSDLKDVKVDGDAKKGAELVAQNCIACHSLEKAGFPAPLDNATASMSYGVVPPDLSTAGALYDAKYLANFIANPVEASKVSHKFVDGKTHPMPGYDWLGEDAIADMVTFFKSIADENLEARKAFEDACSRCHSMKYDKVTALTDDNSIKGYMGKLPPDLSMYIKSRGEDYLHKFINDPQKLLEGTSMPRVGLTKEAEVKVVKYMESIGDAKKDEREALGKWVLIYMVILSVLAFLWKKKIWKEVS